MRSYLTCFSLFSRWFRFRFLCLGLWSRDGLGPGLGFGRTLLGDENLVDVWQDTTLTDGHIFQQLQEWAELVQCQEWDR